MASPIEQPASTAGPNYLGYGSIASAACLICINVAVSHSLSLGLDLQLIIASARCVLQLTILGFILIPIFTSQRWYVVVGYALLMALVGAYEATSRPSHSFKGIFLETFACTVASCSIILTYALFLVVRSHPWWEPQILIPILGMLLGNCISGISVGLSSLLEDFTNGRDKIELLLSLGATRWEASRETIARSVKLALTPTLNQMSVVGIVSIPGMMTGQILGGSDPSQAARYQIIIMFLLAASTGTAVVAVVILASASIVDSCHRLRPERIVAKTRRLKLDQRIKEATVGAGDGVREQWGRAYRKFKDYWHQASDSQAASHDTDVEEAEILLCTKLPPSVAPAALGNK